MVAEGLRSHFAGGERGRADEDKQAALGIERWSRLKAMQQRVDDFRIAAAVPAQIHNEASDRIGIGEGKHFPHKISKWVAGLVGALIVLDKEGLALGQVFPPIRQLGIFAV